VEAGAKKQESGDRSLTRDPWPLRLERIPHKRNDKLRKRLRSE
jgi:hypothetical protein